MWESVHSTHTWSQNLGSCDHKELWCAGLSSVLEPVRWGDVIHVYSSRTCWRSPVCPNTAVGCLCTGRHQDSLLFVLSLQKSLVGRRAPGEVRSSDAMYYKEYMRTMMVLTSITLSWRKFSFFWPFYFCFWLLLFFSSCYYFLWNFGVFISLSIF